MQISTYRLHQDQFNSIQNQLQPNLENGVVRSVDARKLYPVCEAKTPAILVVGLCDRLIVLIWSNTKTMRFS